VHTSFRILYQEYDLDIESKCPTFVCFTWFGCLLLYLLIICFIFCLLYNMLKIFFSSLSFLLVYVSLLGFSFLQWSPIYWCEQMWKPLEVLRAVEMLCRVVPMIWVMGHCWAPFEELLVYYKFLALWAIFCKTIVLLSYVLWHRGVPKILFQVYYG